MYNPLISMYESKSDLDLLYIAQNVDGGYTQDASDTAKMILSSRYKSNDLEQLLREIVENLNELAKGCSICYSSEVSYRQDFFLCGFMGIDTQSSIPGLAAALLLGVGFIKEKYACHKLQFNICQRCLDMRIDKKNNIRISLQDYQLHPLFELYRLMGYAEVRTKI